ncbi:monodehydroascorbate reductase, partial [Tanacetum coccineum]
MNCQKTNVPVPPSTGVNSCTDASGSQPRSNTKKNRILTAKSVNMKKVEEHLRTIKSSLKTTNRVDSSISSKRTVVQIVLWYLDSGCSKHMTGDRSRLRNFMKKFIGTVRFGNDHFGAIMGYGDYVIGESVISRVYYVEGLGHNLFSVGQFCDSDLEVAFRKHSCYVRDTDGVELIKGSRGSNLYTISIEDMLKSSPICLLSKASKNKSWLWHRRLNHLNFGTINDLARKDLVRGLPRLKFEKDHLCSACQLGKSKKHTHKPKTENTNLEVLNTLHMDLYGPISKDETLEVVIKHLKQIQVGLNKTFRNICTDNDTVFVNKDLTEGEFLVEKSQEDESEKTNTESEVHLSTCPYGGLSTTTNINSNCNNNKNNDNNNSSSTSSTTTRLFRFDLNSAHHMADLEQANLALEERMDKHGSRLYKLENLNIPHQVSKAVDEVVTNAVDWAIQAPLRDRFRDLPEADMKEILHHRMWESNSYQAHEDHKMLYEALEKSMARDHTDHLLTDLAKARRKNKKRHASLKTPLGSPPHQPPPPPPPASSSGTPGASGASRSSLKIDASAEYMDWMTIDTSLKPSVLSILKELHMDDDTTHDERVQSSGDEDIGHDHIPMVNLRKNWWKPLTEDKPATPKPAWSIPSSDLPTGDMAIFIDWFCKKQVITELKQQDLEGLVYEIVKVFHPNVIHLQYQMEECHKLLTDQVDESIIRYNVSKPLPLGGPPGQVTIQSDFFFNKDLEYLRYGRKSGRPALSISKMKAAYYPDVGQRFYINRHTSEGDRRAVRTYSRILSVVRIEVFSLYGYDYMKKIVLHRADLKKYTIAERDFKYLYPCDFEDLYLLNLQGHLDHLPPEDKKILTTTVNLWTRNLVIRQRVEDFQLRIESYQMQLNLTKPRWDATGFEFKHDFTVIDSPRAVTFRDKYGVQMIMRFNEIHKFSDGTLQQIDEALDYRVKEFKVNRMNPGLNTRFWTRKDVDRSKEFMFAIQK